MARKQKKATPKTVHTSSTTKQPTPVSPTRQTETTQPVALRPLTQLPQTVSQDKQTAHRHILHWQKVAGNKAVAHALQRQSDLTTPTLSMQTTSQPVVQREYSEYDYTTQVTTPMRVTVTLGAPGNYSEVVEIANNDDLSRAYSEIGTAMFFDRDDFFPDTYDNEYYDKWSEMDDTTRYYAQWYQEQPATEAPYIAEVKDMKKLMAEARALALKCRESYKKKDDKFKKELGKARAQAIEAEKDTKKLLRADFLSGGGGSSTTSAFLWAMTDHLFTFSGTVADAMEMPYMQALTYGKLIPGAVTLANVVVNWSSKNPMMMGTAFEGLAALNNAVSLAGAANSFFVNPGYLVTAYVGPMLSAITTMLGKLQVQLIERNDEAAEFLGTPLYIGAEPGGEAMWNYMVTAMRASSSGDIPKPSGAIFDYFDEFREQFDEAGEAKYEGELESFRSGDRDEFPTEAGAIPTESSYWVFTDVNAKKFPAWLFKNRHMVWTLLYGARDPQKAKLTTE